MATISLDLLIDKEKNRVVFAESDGQFVDTLFSFLTLPVGTIVRVLGKQSGVGCMDKLYQSVENLDMQFLEAQACKNMLLEPRSSSEFECKHLKIRIEDMHPRNYYLCGWSCSGASSFHGAQCTCGHTAKQSYAWGPSSSEVGDGLFVRGVARFIVGDDLHVMKASTAATISLFQKLGVKNAGVLERKEVSFGREEILKLLKRALQSKSPLTDIFLQKADSTEICTKEFKLIDTTAVKSETETQTGSGKICINLIESKATNKLVFADAEDNFANLLFSFLTFPLGAIVRLLHKNSNMGSMDELYKSIEGLSVDDCITSKEYKNKLLDPKLPFHYRCSNSLFRIDEVKLGLTTEINPKLPMPGKGVGGSFIKRCSSFTVTDEMVVTHRSLVSNVEIFKELKAPIETLVERKVAIGETEALKLLKACLISRSALSTAFSPKK